jgi:hypothetical protein
MSPPKTANRDPAEYLASVLLLNPIFQADEILAARDRFLGRESQADASPEIWQLQEQREELQTQIDLVRENFWTMKPKELREALEALKVDQFPDLSLATERLRAAFRVRSEFPKLSQHKHSDQELFEKLKEIAVAAPREAGRTKQAFFLRTSANLKLHRRCRAMIKTMRKEFPELFQLEREWLQQIESTKPIAGKTESEKEAAQRSGNSSGRIGWVVVCVLLSGLGRAFFRSDRPSTTTPPRSTPVWNAPALPPQPQPQSDATERTLEILRKVAPNSSPNGVAPRTPQDIDALRQRLREQREQFRNRSPSPNPQTPRPFPSGVPQGAESR